MESRTWAEAAVTCVDESDNLLYPTPILYQASPTTAAHAPFLSAVCVCDDEVRAMAKRRKRVGETQTPKTESSIVQSPQFGTIVPQDATIESPSYGELLDALLLPTVHPLEMGLYQAWKGVMLREVALSQQEQSEEKKG